MKEDPKIIHKHNFNPFKTWHMFALAVPSVVFVFGIVYFFNNSYVSQSAMSTESDYKTAIDKEESTRNSTVVIDEIINIEVEVVESELDRNIGLSKYESLEDGKGMLFIFNPDSSPTFWMKNMKFPIDIIRIKEGKVVQIDADIDPQPGVSDSQLKLYPSNQPIDYILEVPAGFSSKSGIEVGSSVEVPRSQKQ